MNTIEDFENAPIGATATSPNGRIAIKTERRALEWSLYDSRGFDAPAILRSDEMVGFTLNPVAPTTAREALDLVWELAHPVKEGQVISLGAWVVARKGNGITVGKNDYFDVTAIWWDAEHLRTLDPLPEPEPDWLNAPAVMAHAEDEEPHVWVNVDAQGWQDEHGNTRQWAALRDVTPLYPKEGQDA